MSTDNTDTWQIDIFCVKFQLKTSNFTTEVKAPLTGKMTQFSKLDISAVEVKRKLTFKKFYFCP